MKVTDKYLSKREHRKIHFNKAFLVYSRFVVVKILHRNEKCIQLNVWILHWKLSLKLVSCQKSLSWRYCKIECRWTCVIQTLMVRLLCRVIFYSKVIMAKFLNGGRLLMIVVNSEVGHGTNIHYMLLLRICMKKSLQH